PPALPGEVAQSDPGRDTGPAREPADGGDEQPGRRDEPEHDEDATSARERRRPDVPAVHGERHAERGGDETGDAERWPGARLGASSRERRDDVDPGGLPRGEPRGEHG